VLFKVLNPDLTSGVWSDDVENPPLYLAQTRQCHWTPGVWQPEVAGDLSPCNNGYHLVTERGLLFHLWSQAQIWEAEPGGDLAPWLDGILAARQAIITRQTAWDEQSSWAFALDLLKLANDLIGTAQVERDIDVTLDYLHQRGSRLAARKSARQRWPHAEALTQRQAEEGGGARRNLDTQYLLEGTVALHRGLDVRVGTNLLLFALEIYAAGDAAYDHPRDMPAMLERFWASDVATEIDTLLKTRLGVT
jgi:hypothetical protein